MCLLSYYKPGVMPVASELREGSISNPDGSGYAIATGDGLIIGRSLDADALIEEFARVRAMNPDAPALFHSRFGTGGLYTEYNCHPFTMGGDPMTVVAHNGIFPKISRKQKRKDKRSDTRVFAERIMPSQFHALDKPRCRAALERYCRDGYVSKIVVLTVNPRYRERAYLIGESDGIWAASGAWHSNYDYLPPLITTYQGDGEADAADLERGTCDICLAKNSVNFTLGLCEFCQCCQDCREPVQDCQCYYGAAEYEVNADGKWVRVDGVADLVTLPEVAGPPGWQADLAGVLERDNS